MDVSQFVNGSEALIQALVEMLFTAASVVIGVWIIVSGFMKIVADARGQRHGKSLFGPVAVNLVIGSMFLQFAFWSNSFVELLFGTDRVQSSNALSYMPASVSENQFWSLLASGIVMWVAFFGVIAIFRGLLLWNQLSQGENHQSSDLGWRGLWHIVGGAICYNIGGVGALF